MSLIGTLCDLRAALILIKAADEGVLTELRCAMENCVCPKGRGYFEQRGAPSYGPWAPSADRWPVPARDGGQYVLDNVRLAHTQCNRIEGASIGGVRGGPIGGRNGRHEDRVRAGRIGGRLGDRELKRAGGRKGALNQPREAKVLGGLNSRSQSRAGKKGGPIGMCVRWNVRRGKPCTCGVHNSAVAI